MQKKRVQLCEGASAGVRGGACEDGRGSRTGQAHAQANRECAEAENTVLQHRLNVKTTDLVNSQDKRASTARACRQQEETIRSLEERVKELSSELSACKAEQEAAGKRSSLESRASARDHTTALREQTMRANAAEQAKAKAEVAAAAAELCTH